MSDPLLMVDRVSHPRQLIEVFRVGGWFEGWVTDHDLFHETRVFTLEAAFERLALRSIAPAFWLRTPGHDPAVVA